MEPLWSQKGTVTGGAWYQWYHVSMGYSPCNQRGGGIRAPKRGPKGTSISRWSGDPILVPLWGI